MQKKLQLLLALVLLGSGCTRQKAPAVDLPIARHAPQIDDRDPRRIPITFDSNRTVWLIDKPASMADLETFLAKPEHDRFPVAIRVERSTPFPELWELLSICRSARRASLSLEIRTPDGEEREIRFFSSSLNPGISYLILTRASDGYVINDRTLAPDELERILGKLAGLSSTQTLVISPRPTDTVQDIVTLMDLCLKKGLSNISINETASNPEMIEELPSVFPLPEGGTRPAEASTTPSP